MTPALSGRRWATTLRCSSATPRRAAATCYWPSCSRAATRCSATRTASSPAKTTTITTSAVASCPGSARGWATTPARVTLSWMGTAERCCRRFRRCRRSRPPRGTCRVGSMARAPRPLAGGRRPALRRWSRRAFCRSSTATASRSTRSSAWRTRDCVRDSRRRGAGTCGPWCRHWSARPRDACGRPRLTWSARSYAARSLRRSSGRWSPRDRRGRASPTATKRRQWASAPRSASSCSRRRAPAPRARPPWPRTRSRAASSRIMAPPTDMRRGRARRAARRTRACCCCRAGTCACAPGARRPSTRAPCARPPRTHRSTSSSPEQTHANV